MPGTRQRGRSDDHPDGTLPSDSVTVTLSYQLFKRKTYWGNRRLPR